MIRGQPLIGCSFMSNDLIGQLENCSKDIEVEYNLYQMSIVGNYRDAMHRITQEKAKVSQ